MAVDGDGSRSSTCVLLLTARPLHELLVRSLLGERPGPQQLDHVIPGVFNVQHHIVFSAALSTAEC